MYGIGERVALPPGMSGIFDEGGFLDKALNTVGKAVDTVKQGQQAYQQVQSGNAKIQVVPTAQGYAQAASPYMPYLIAGGIGLVLFLVMKRR